MVEVPTLPFHPPIMLANRSIELWDHYESRAHPVRSMPQPRYNQALIEFPSSQSTDYPPIPQKGAYLPPHHRLLATVHDQTSATKPHPQAHNNNSLQGLRKCHIQIIPPPEQRQSFSSYYIISMQHEKPHRIHHRPNRIIRSSLTQPPLNALPYLEKKKKKKKKKKKAPTNGLEALRDSKQEQKEMPIQENIRPRLGVSEHGTPKIA